MRHRVVLFEWRATPDPSERGVFAIHRTNDENILCIAKLFKRYLAYLAATFPLWSPSVVGRKPFIPVSRGDRRRDDRVAGGAPAAFATVPVIVVGGGVDIEQSSEAGSDVAVGNVEARARDRQEELTDLGGRRRRRRRRMY